MQRAARQLYILSLHTYTNVRIGWYVFFKLKPSITKELLQLYSVRFLEFIELYIWTIHVIIYKYQFRDKQAVFVSCKKMERQIQNKGEIIRLTYLNIVLKLINNDPFWSKLVPVHDLVKNGTENTGKIRRHSLHCLYKGLKPCV